MNRAFSGIVLFSFTSGYYSIIDWLQSHMLSCPSKKFLHMECPGCGFQRSLLEILKGEWVDSFKLYPATIPIIFLFAFTFLHLKYKFVHGALVIKCLQLFVAFLIVVFYIYKIVNHKITA